MKDILGVCIIAAILSWFLTRFLRWYAISRSVMDIPNARSSHTEPTPRGGGMAIIIVFLTCLAVLFYMSRLDVYLFVALTGAGLGVAIIGFMDDHGHIAARWRLLTHFSSAGWLLFWLGGLPPLLLFGSYFDLGWFGHLMALVVLVWLLNLYNFMDGIDGIAGIEALSSSLVVGLFFLFLLNNEEVASLHLLMSASVAGFLVWNFPPAKIFMGDAGSGFLGLMLGGLALYSAHIVPQMLWVWLIMLGVFIVDSSYTLLRRLLRGDKVYEAHRSHAYQYASRKYAGHRPVTLAVLIINLLWLAPWSFFVASDSVDGVLGLVVAYLPLLWLVWYLRAGELEDKEDV